MNYIRQTISHKTGIISNISFVDESSKYIKSNPIVKWDAIVISYFIMIFSLIINGNRFHASIRFILSQTVISVGFCIISLIGKKIDYAKLRSYIPIACLIIISIVSTIVSDVVTWTTTATSLVVYSIVFVLFTINTYQPSTIRLISCFYAFFTLTISALLLLSLTLGISMVDGRVSLSFFGVRKDENYLSAFLAFGFYYFFMSFLYGSHKKRYLTYSIIVFLSFFMTGSRGALVAMISVLGLIVIFYFFQTGINSRTLMFAIVLIFALILGYFIIRNTSIFSRMTNIEGYKDNIRIHIWNYAMEGYRQKPLIGSGIQSGTYYAQLHVKWYTHSCFVDLITSAGILGVIAFAIQIVQMCKKAIQKHFANLLYIAGTIVILFGPLMFINGFETATFWIPLALCKQVSDCCIEHRFEELLL